MAQDVLSALLNSIKQRIIQPGEWCNCIDEEATTNANSGREYFGYGRLRIYFKKGTSGQKLWALRRLLPSNLALASDDTNRLPWPGSANARVSVEVAPRKTVHVQASDKCRAVWAQVCRNGTIMRSGLGSGLGETYAWARASSEAQNA
eukprot:1036501-Pyramimonas_sp.AAC.1